MVRIEKIVYEKAFNTSALGRSRNLTTPMKWFTTNPYEHAAKLSHSYFNTTWLGKLTKPFFRAWFNHDRSYQRDLFLQQGLTFEDKLLHNEADLRRNVLWEHIARESLHPYHWVLKARRRERYYRIERACQGYFVPEFIREEVKTQTWSDLTRLRKEWWAFVHNNYYSDMTPMARRTVVPTIFPLELILNYGVLKTEAWDRYFFTERDPQWYTEKDVKIVRDSKRFPYDLTTSEGKKEFEREITELNNKHPGLVAPEGQSFDFKKHYAEVGV